MSKPEKPPKQVVDLNKPLPLKVLATPAKGATDGATTSWTLTPSARNIAPEYIVPTAVAKVHAAQVTGTAEGWPNAVLLPHIGGETHELRVTRVDKAELVKAVDIVTTREIPVTVYYVDSTAKRVWKAAFKHFTAAFAPVGISFKVVAMVKTDKGDVDFEKGIDREEFLPGDLAKLFTATALPAVDPAVGHLRVFVVKDYRMLLDVPWGGAVSADQLREMQRLPVYDVLPAGPAKLTRAPVLVAKLAFRRRASIDMRPVVRRHADKQIKVVPTDEMIAAAAQAGGAEIQVKVEAIETGFLGWSDLKNLVVVGSRKASGGELSAETVAKTAIHEVGHALGLVTAGRYKFSGLVPVVETNDFRYEEHGGKGPHCSSEAEEYEGESPDGQAMTLMRWKGPKDLCVMFHDSKVAKAKPKFCPSCTKDLKLADLRTSGIRAAWTT